MNFIDLFAGCGGLSEGFSKIPQYKHVASVEWDKSACETLRQRLSHHYPSEDVTKSVIHFDIQKTESLISGKVDDSKYENFVGLDKLCKGKSIDLIIGGPPCQAYSLAGRVRDPNGMRNDYRNYLFESYIKVLKRFKPKAFIFENVPGILNAKPGGIKIIDIISQAFSEAGYSICGDLKSHALLNLAEFGVPQNRNRVIIFGVRNDYQNNSDGYSRVDEFYARLNDKKESIQTVHSAISDLRPIFPTKKPSGRISHKPDEDYPNHSPRYHNLRDIKIFKDLAKDIETGRMKYTSTEALKKLYTERTGKTSKIHKYYVLRKDKPSNLIPAHLYKDGLRHIHYDSKQARSITVREAARLQTFSDDFILYGSMGDQYKMIGNAVPPKFSQKMAEAFLKI